MKYLRHPVAGMVLFVVLISLCIGIYSTLQEQYSFTEGDIKTITREGSTAVHTGNIADQFKNMTLLDGINTIEVGIQEISPPTSLGGFIDLLGGLVSVGIGVVKSIIGIVTTPFEVIHILLTFYTEIPDILIKLCLLAVVYVGFILLSMYLNRGEL